jgi:hypothetical protein
MAVKKQPAKKSSSKEVALWDEELAKQADLASKQEEASAGGQFFSTRGGTLSWGDAPLPNNQMAVIILDGVLENVYYEGRYDPDTPQGPTCFAFGRDEKDMAPHIIVSDAGQAQSLDGCANCEHNEFGTADTGRGKACRNTRRLAMIPAGTLNNRGDFELFDEDHFEDATIGYMKLPVTSVKGYASFVKQVAATLRRPPHGIIAKVRVVPDPKTQFKVVFEAIENVPNDVLGIIMKRHEEAKSSIDFPYQLDDPEEKPVKRKAGKPTPAKKPTKRKY